QSFEYQLNLANKSQLDQSQLQLKCRFLLEPDISFTPQLTIRGLDPLKLEQFPRERLELLIFQLGLAELPSYWKCACPSVIRIEASALDDRQVFFWKEVLRRGLGEFFYTNQLDPALPESVKIEVNSPQRPAHLPSIFSNWFDLPYLVPVGGGKDSGLTLALLDRHQATYHTLVLEPASPAAALLAQRSSASGQIVAKRIIDPTLLKLNQQGYLNGHTPFSAYLAFLSTLIAQIGGYQQILVANESSANQANLYYQNQPINHQWSKSFAFEKMFREYSALFLDSHTRQAEYLSLLRPLNELQISARFAKLTDKLSLFRSCNRNQKENRWCHHCPKCAFVYAMLAPFVSPTILASQVFNHDLWSKPNLYPFFQALADPSIDKPLDCVGTDLEVRVALALTISTYRQNRIPLPVVLAKLANWLETHYSMDKLLLNAQELLSSWNDEHFLDDSLEALIRQE
ncbi:MAG TPA: hypothetical protein PLM16_02640, partial [Candidatus Woesebacteria bacterium]|nr:hypothetical protein [Candidatus Woesebacteria bacterium]